MTMAYRHLKHTIHQVMNKYGNNLSYATKYERLSRLMRIGIDLHETGYKVQNIACIKPRHVYKLVAHWQARELSAGRIKNFMSDLRFIYRLFNEKDLPDNDTLGIANRSYVLEENKAIDEIDLSVISDEYLRCSMELQRHFGLRREECLKIKPRAADKGKRLWLKSSWTKGNVERYIPIKTEEQRYWLDKAKEIAKTGSLIPVHKTYKQQRDKYDLEVEKQGWSNLHGLRHAYAQRRYSELSGLPSPIVSDEKVIMDEEKQSADLTAKEIVSQELGHSRPEILGSYIGRW